MRLLKRRRLQTAESGFAMPTVILLTVVMSLVAFATLVQANNALNLSYKQAYIQMTRIASKAAIDYAQEQFDNSTGTFVNGVCTTPPPYSGTAEQDLIANDRYRLTFKAEVLETSADGLQKTVKGTGSIYLPKSSETAQYVFDIRSEIVSTYAACKTPDNFGPLVWLDASDTDTLKKTSIPSTTQTSTAGQGILDLFLPNDTIEERVTDGSQGALSWLSNDIEMHTCDTLEFLFSCSGSLANRDLYNGIVFQNINIPKNASIVSATLSLKGAVPSGSGSPITQRVYGLYNTTTNPHLPLFDPFGSNQVRSRITNTSLRTAAYRDQTLNNFPPGNSVNYNVTSIVQEMVNNPNWNPTGGGNNGRLGLALQRLSGTGSKKACKGNPGSSCSPNGVNNGPQLVVTYSTTASVQQTVNGEGVDEWQDKSGNDNHARFTYGNKPVRTDNQINGHSIVRFNNGAMLSALNTALAGKREMTVFAVVKANYASSATDGRIISGMTNTTANDTAGTTTIVPLLRNGVNSGFSSIYASSASSNRTDYSCNIACASVAYAYTSVFRSENLDDTTAQLKGAGVLGTEKTGISPSGTPPYTYGINQIYFGGTRTGLSPGSGTNYFNGDYAELIVYDYALTCQQVESIEEYLRSKWNTSPSQLASACSVDTIPTL